MSDVVVERGAITTPVPLVSPRELWPYAVFAGVLMLLLVYFVGAEEGAASVFSGTFMHEVVHDGRHLLAFPCH